MEIIGIISIVISSIVLIVGIVLLIIVLRKSKTPTGGEVQIDLKEFGALSKQIEMLSKDMNTSVELALSKEIGKFYESSGKQNEANNEKLERFQKNITDSLNHRFDALNEQMVNRLVEINKKVDEKLQEGFKGTSESMAQVRERLQAIDVAQKNIESLSKDMLSLKQVLEGNQTRGKFGEFQLSMVLNSVFGDTIGCYEEQYTFKKVVGGEKVRADAVVFMPEPNKLICIDSKFPFQDYARLFDANGEEEVNELNKSFAAAIKKHITDIKNKYIIDGETAPEAIMFIPNDGIFAYIHHHLEETVNYARESRVIITSPSTLPSILVTINMVRIEVERAKNVKEITKQLTRLGKDFEMFSREWDDFSNKLEKATTGRERLDKRVGKITSKFDSIKTNSPEELEDNEPQSIEFED